MAIASDQKTKEPWHEQLASLARSDDPWLTEEIKASLQTWLDRFSFYDDIDDPTWRRINKWKQNHTLKSEATLFLKVIPVLEELYFKQSSEQSNEMRQSALDIIRMKLLRLELAQCKLFEKTQNTKRYLSWPFGNGKWPLSIRDTKDNLLARQENIKHQKPRYSKQAKTQNLHHTHHFFKKHESEIDFKSHIQKASKGSAIMSLINAINTMSATFFKLIATGILVSLAGIVTVLQTVPIIGAMINAIPIVMRAAKAWVENKSPLKQTIALSGVAITLGALVATGFGALLAASITGIGLLAIGISMRNIAPWIKQARRLHHKQAELKELEETNKASLLFGFREKQFILCQLEEYWLQKDANREQLKSLRNHVMQATSLEQLRNNLELVAYFDNDIAAFLKKKQQQRCDDLIIEISELAKKESRSRSLVMTNLLSLVGAILICIPTPITMVIGASILLSCAIANVMIEFNLVQKISRGMAKLWRSTPNTSVHSATAQRNPLRPIIGDPIPSSPQPIPPPKPETPVPNNKPTLPTDDKTNAPQSKM